MIGELLDPQGADVFALPDCPTFLSHSQLGQVVQSYAINSQACQFQLKILRTEPPRANSLKTRPQSFARSVNQTVLMVWGSLPDIEASFLSHMDTSDAYRSTGQ